MVELVDIVLAIASFGPALLLLYMTLRDYTFPRVEKPFFDDRKVFAFLTFGIVLGTVYFFIDSLFGLSGGLDFVLLIGLAIPLLQSLIKLAILNWTKFQRKVDTSFYGLSLGLGISATYAFAKMYQAAKDPSIIGLTGTIDLGSLSLIIMMGVQIVLIHGSTTAMIGVGVARGHPWTYFGYAMMFALAYSYMLYGSAIAADAFGAIAAELIILATWVVCIYAYWHVYRIDFPNLIDDAKRGFRGPTKKKR
jgi:hypothetical protein